MLKLSEADELMIRYADTLSPAAISFKLEGMFTAAQVKQRIDFLLATPDWLTAAQQDQLVTMKMRLLIVKLEEMMSAMPAARTAEVLGAQLDRLGNRLDRRLEATEKDLTSLYGFQGALFLDMVSIAMEYMKRIVVEVTSSGEGLTEEMWNNHLETAIRYAEVEMSKTTGDPVDTTGLVLEGAKIIP